MNVVTSNLGLGRLPRLRHASSGDGNASIISVHNFTIPSECFTSLGLIIKQATPNNFLPFLIRGRLIW